MSKIIIGEFSLVIAWRTVIFGNLPLLALVMSIPGFFDSAGPFDNDNTGALGLRPGVFFFLTKVKLILVYYAGFGKSSTFGRSATISTGFATLGICCFISYIDFRTGLGRGSGLVCPAPAEQMAATFAAASRLMGFAGFTTLVTVGAARSAFV